MQENKFIKAMDEYGIMRVFSKFLFSFTVIYLLISCGSSSSCDGVSAPDPGVYSITYYNLMPIEFTQELNADNDSYHSNIVVDESNEVSWLTFGIEITADTTIMYSNNRFKFNFSLLNKAYACSFVPNNIALQKISNISIVSDNAFSENFPSGSELKELFEVVYFNANQTPVEEHTLLDYNTLDFPAPTSIQLHLLQKPDDLRQKFLVEITLDDGSLFIMETGDIYFSELQE